MWMYTRCVLTEGRESTLTKGVLTGWQNPSLSLSLPRSGEVPEAKDVIHHALRELGL